MIHLAELNHNSICIGVKTVKSFIDDGKHVEIESPDFDYYAWRKFEGYHEEPIMQEQQKLDEEGNLLFDGDEPIMETIEVGIKRTPIWSNEKHEPQSTALLSEFEQLRADVDKLIIDSLGGI